MLLRAAGLIMTLFWGGALRHGQRIADLSEKYFVILNTLVLRKEFRTVDL